MSFSTVKWCNLIVMMSLNGNNWNVWPRFCSSVGITYHAKRGFMSRELHEIMIYHWFQWPNPKDYGQNLQAQHWNDGTMTVIISQITGESTDYSTIWSGQYQSKHQIPHYWPLRVTASEKWFPAQRTEKAEGVSKAWRHHSITKRNKRRT